MSSSVLPGNRFMPKVLTIMAMVVAALVLLVFVLDLAISIPFARANVMMDVAFILCALMLGYMSWSAYRDQV